MVDRVVQYRRSKLDVGSYDEDVVDHRSSPYKPRHSAQADIDSEDSVPLFLCDSDRETDSSEYIASLRKTRSVSISSRILMGVWAVAAAAILFALLSSDAARHVVVNVKASMAAASPAPSAAAQPDPSQLIARDGPSGNTARPLGPENQTPGIPRVTMAAVVPTREEIKSAYQSALSQGRAPAAAPVAEPATSGDVVHHLDPDVIASLLKRADSLIASGDIAAARLVLRRAADAGDARVAMMLGGTYDPVILEKLGVHGFVPDIAMARSWYERAKRFGSAEAPQRLEMLASRRQ